MEEYKITIRFWYLEDGTPEINQKDIDNLGINYLTYKESRKIRESLRRTLKNTENSFKQNGLNLDEGKLELIIKK